MFGFFDSPRRPKRSQAARVKKLAAKVAKLEAKARMKTMEGNLKNKLSKLRGL